MTHVGKIGQHKNRNWARHMVQLPFNVLKRPEFGDVKDKDDAVGLLVHVEELGVEAGLKLLRLVAANLEAGQLLSLLCNIHHVPNFDLNTTIKAQFFVQLYIRKTNAFHILIHNFNKFYQKKNCTQIAHILGFPL